MRKSELAIAVEAELLPVSSAKGAMKPCTKTGMPAICARSLFDELTHRCPTAELSSTSVYFDVLEGGLMRVQNSIHDNYPSGLERWDTAKYRVPEKLFLLMCEDCKEVLHIDECADKDRCCIATTLMEIKNEKNSIMVINANIGGDEVKVFVSAEPKKGE